MATIKKFKKMPKRNNPNDISPKNSSKKSDYNLWKAEENNMTSQHTPTSSSNKYNFNVWSNSTNENVTKPIKICEMMVGVCTQRTFIFRVSFKSEKRGSKIGDMFVFHAMDSDNEIQITVFAQQTQKFFDVIELNHVYELINFNVKKQSEDFPLFIGEGVYVSLLSNTKINEIDNNLSPPLRFNFLNIKDINSLENNSKCDCVAIIAKNWGQEVVGQNKLKRDLTLTDTTKECIMVSLWGTAYAEFEHIGTCVVIHNGVIKEYNGVKTVSCSPNTLFWHDPEEIGADLKSWYGQEIQKMKK